MTKTTRRTKKQQSTGEASPVPRIPGVSRAVLIAYCESGVLPVPPGKLEECELDDEMIRTIRRIEFLREHHGIDLAGIRIISELMREVEHLREELRFHTGV